MTSLDDFREKAEAAIEQAKPIVEGVVNASAQFAEKADEWASVDRPGLDGAVEGAGAAAGGAVDLLANGANAAYEFIKDRVEEASRMDLDGDGKVGKIDPEDVKAGVELAAEAASDAVDKAAAEAGLIAPGDVVAGAELAAEAVADAVDKAAKEAGFVAPGDVKAGVELAAEAVSDTVGKAAAEIASITPEDVQAGAELAAEAVADAVDKIAGEQN